MGNGLPVVSGRKFVSFLYSEGYEYRRQRGSHIILSKPGCRRPITVPDKREVSIGVTKSILNETDLRDEFIEFFSK